MATPYATLTPAERFLAELAGDLPSQRRAARVAASRIAEFFAGVARARGGAS